MVYLNKQDLARTKLSAQVDREQGLLHLIFDVGYDPVLLPDNTPDVIVSAWNRLHTQAVKDVDLIRSWLDYE